MVRIHWEVRGHAGTGNHSTYSCYISQSNRNTSQEHIWRTSDMFNEIAPMLRERPAVSLEAGSMWWPLTSRLVPSANETTVHCTLLVLYLYLYHGEVYILLLLLLLTEAVSDSSSSAVVFLFILQVLSTSSWVKYIYIYNNNIYINNNNTSWNWLPAVLEPPQQWEWSKHCSCRRVWIQAIRVVKLTKSGTTEEDILGFCHLERKMMSFLNATNLFLSLSS